jgi:hypothetical protein
MQEEEFSTAKGCDIILSNCVEDTPDTTASAASGRVENYIVSDMRAVVKGAGTIFALETVEEALAGQASK